MPALRSSERSSSAVTGKNGAGAPRPATSSWPAFPSPTRRGADADLVVFDLATVSDRGTFTQPNQTAIGMRYVIVNGTPVIRDGELVQNALPGRAIRRPAATR